VKKYGLFALTAILGSLAQNAMAFEIAGNASVTPNVVAVQFCNTDFDTVINCDVSATGLLNTGYPIFANVDLMLAPGQCNFAYVYATYPFFFMNGGGTGECQ
jgi:hypothetical protein